MLVSSFAGHDQRTDSLYQKVKIVRLNRDTPHEPCAKRRRVDQPIAPGGDLFDFLDVDEPITTGVAGSSESEVEEYLAQPPPLRKQATLCNSGKRMKKMAKSSYLSFEISGHSGIISSCGAFVQRCRQGLQTRACIAVGQTLRGADVHPVQQVNLHDGALVITC